MALILVRVEDIDDVLYESSSHRVQIQLLDLYQVILGYGDETSATVTKTKDTEFMIITTRGRLEESTEVFLGLTATSSDKSQHKSENNHGSRLRSHCEDGGSQCPTGCKVV